MAAATDVCLIEVTTNPVASSQVATAVDEQAVRGVRVYRIDFRQVFDVLTVI